MFYFIYIYIGKEFQKEVLHVLSFIKHELRRIVNNQRDITLRLDAMECNLEKMSSSDMSATLNKISTSITDMISCPLPLNNIKDLEILEERISEDCLFRSSLVRNYKIQY